MKPEIALVQCNFRHTFAIPSLLHSENVHEIRDDVINSVSNEQFTSDDTDSFVLILCQTRLKEKEHGIILSAPSLSLSHSHIHAGIYKHTDIYTHACIHIHMHKHRCIHRHIQKCLYIHTQTYTCRHTQTEPFGIKIIKGDKFLSASRPFLASVEP